MSARLRPRRRAALAAAILAALAASALLVGCEDVFNSVFDTGAPSGVSASDGEHANRIDVSWSAPSLSSDKWKNHSVSRYEISWTSENGDSGSDSTGSTGYSIPVAAENRAQYYEVTVESVLSPSGGGSGSDEGFALDTEPLIWDDGGKDYSVAGSDRWYVTMLQRGFTYDFDFQGAQGIVEFYEYKTLDMVHGETSLAEVQSWECDEDGASNKFYIRVEPGAPGASFRAGYAP